MLLKRSSWVLVAVLVVYAADRATAEDRDLAFVHALQSRKYGDSAREFLETVKEKEAVKDVYDLELSKSLRIEADTVNDPVARKTVLDQAAAALNRFAKEKPNHPEALQAQLTNAGMIMDQGTEALAAARSIQDAGEKKAKLAEARKVFEEGRPLLKTAESTLKDRLKKLGPEPTGDPKRWNKKQRDQAEERYRVRVDLVTARARLALVDYYIAQTYPTKEEDGKRRESLNKAAELLDNYYQEYRAANPDTPEARFDLWVHSWHGKVDEELGGLDEAKEIYDEVLENFQDLKDKAVIFPMEAPQRGPIKYQKTDIDDILARTKHFSLLLFLKQHPKRENEYLTMAREFIETEEYKKNLKNEWGYQAAALELAKHVAAAAEKETKPGEKSKLTREAINILKDMASVRSEFHREAIDLRNKLTPGGSEVAQNADDAIDYYRREKENKNWDEAAKWLQKAQELEEKSPKKRPELLSQIQEQLAALAMRPVSDSFAEAKKKGDFTKENWTAWYDGSLKVVQDYKKTLVAQGAMDFALDCAAQLHRIAVDDEKAAKAKRDDAAAKAAAADREAALKRLNDAAALAHANYPGSGEDDKGSMGKARVSAMDGQYADALKVYEAIKPTSDKYAEALDMRGRIYDTLYLTERDKADAARNPKLLEEYRQKAVAALAESVEAAKRKLVPGEPYPATLLETQHVLAQVHLDAKEFKEAGAVVDPIVAALSAAHPMQLDKTMLAIFGDAVRADVGMNDFKKAGDHGKILIDIGPDDPSINAVLVNFILRLDNERKNIQDTLTSLPVSTPPDEAAKIRNNLEAIRTMLTDLATKMSARQQMTPQTLVYIGNLFDALDMPNEAEQQYRSVLQRRDNDPDFGKDKANLKLLNAVRAKQVSLLRKRGKYQESVEEANKLIKEFPDALEPLVERARIYQDWASKDPSKLDDAIGSWTEIRLRLEKTVKRPEPKDAAGKERFRGLQASYFDAIYNTAFCLLTEAKRLQAHDKTAATQKAKVGEQVLTAAFNAFPKLDGTEATQKKFAAIKAQLATFRAPTTTTAASGA